MDREPVFNQTFLFNLSGSPEEQDLHLRVYDSEVLTDSYIGRADHNLFTLLEKGGGEHTFDLFDPENFRKVTGRIEISCNFEGTGGPAASGALAPVVGPFHFQNNASGFMLHPSSLEAGATIVFRAGGLNDRAAAFEWQSSYVRSVAAPGLYLTAAGGDNAAAPLTLQAGISDLARWKWTGLGLQSETKKTIMHPAGEALTPGTAMLLAAGSSAASGFSLVPCAAASPTPVAASSASTAASAPASAPAASAPDLSKLSLEGSWVCQSCTFKNSGGRAACEMCSKSRAASSTGSHGQPSRPSRPAFDLTFPETWPSVCRINGHPHELRQLPTIYKGTYVCDIPECKLQGQVSGQCASTRGAWAKAERASLSSAPLADGC